MHLAICDDEMSQISYISDLLMAYRKEKLPSLRWTTFQSGFALLDAMERGEIFNAVLLDIYMSDMNGMDVAKSIRTTNSSVHILFLTSSPLFAVESYSVDASDYMLKPIKEDKLFQSMDKLVVSMETTAEYGIAVKDTEGRITKVLWSQLMYLEAMGHYVVMYHANGTSTRTLYSFSSLLKQLLVQSSFVQTHRSYIVNLNYVHRISKNEIVLLNDAKLPLPKSRYHEISDKFHNIIFGGGAI